MNVQINIRTYCVERLFIDLPDDFYQVIPLVARIRSKGARLEEPIELSVAAQHIDSASFDEIVKKRRAEIDAHADKTTDILREQLGSKSGEALFRIQRIEDAYSSELHLLREQNYLTLSATSYGGRFLESESLLTALASNVVPLDSTARTQSGFCVGPIVLNGVYEKESVDFTFRSRARPGVLITMEIDSYSHDPRQSLLERVHGPNSLLKIFDVRNKILREGERTIAGMTGQEWLSTAMLGENREEKKVSFALETKRPIPGPRNPHVHVELTATPESASQSDQQLLALWDSITSTIRLAEPAK